MGWMIGFWFLVSGFWLEGRSKAENNEKQETEHIDSQESMCSYLKSNMNNVLGVLGLVGCLLISSFCYHEASAQQGVLLGDERLIPLIAVDTHSISLGVFKKSYVDYLIITGANDTEDNRQKHLQALVDTYLMGEYARRNGADKDAEFVQFSELERKKALGGRYYEIEVINAMQDLSDAEKRIAFAKHKSKVHVRQLYFATEAEANIYYKRLKAGDDFVDLANEVYQTTVYDSTAGDMGYISYFEIDDALAEAAFDLVHQYDYSPPVQSRSGYHILRLENRITTPILTESEYQAHGKGVGEDMQLRSIRLKGDAYVRDLMASLNYNMDEEAVRLLAQRIRAMVKPPEETPASVFPVSKEELSFQEAEDIREMLTPQTTLVTYQWNEETRVFTAGDFFAWLNDLPYAELKSNPVASIGRALRNEVMGMAGEQAGLDADPIVQESILFEEQIYLASKTKALLRQDSLHKPTEDMVKAAFDRLTRHRKESISVDYWKIETATMEEAQRVRDQIVAQSELPTHFSSYQAFEGMDIFTDPQWTSHLRQAPLENVMIVGLREGQWMVFEVTDRQEKPYVFEDAKASLEKQLAPYAGEYFLLKELYERADIEVDHSQFDTWPTR